MMTISLTKTAVCCLSFLLSLLPLIAADSVLFDFESENWQAAGWETSGTAFGEGPASGRIGGQMPVMQFKGNRLVNSFFGGSDRPVGTLTSPPFKIERRYINFLIGGGAWPGETCVNLIIDNKIVRTATGWNTQRGGSETLLPQSWGVNVYMGKTARLQVVDKASGGWGHITLDHVVQSDKPSTDSPIATLPSETELSASPGFESVRQRIQKFEKVTVDHSSPDYERAANEVRKIIGREDLTLTDQLRATREMRERLWADPYRPAYHLLPPDGLWNDINGTIYWKGRYHVFFLGRQSPELEAVLSGKDTAWPREVWLHASSTDLLHWIWHPTALRFPQDGSMPRGLFSGNAIAGADRPTLIYHVPSQGICISTADDDGLINWTPSPHNPIIPAVYPDKEVAVFDPTAWKEGDSYYALIGNKNRRPGYEGDTPSLFKSTDLIHWEYLYPFYKSNREWTHVDSDAACPDFFPIGNGKHMLVTHVHNPMFLTQYYIGTWKNEVFTPEQHGQMSWAGGQLSGPETMIDGKGRRIFFGWVREAKPMRKNGWESMGSLPRVLSLAQDNTLRITPPDELKILRTNKRCAAPMRLNPNQDIPLSEFSGNVAELALVLDSAGSDVSVSVLKSPDGVEQTTILYSPKEQTLTIDVSRSSLDPSVRYFTFTPRYADQHGIPPAERTTTKQVAPLKLPRGEPLKLRIYIDRSIVEVFANDIQCVTQRVYPARKDALGVSIRAASGNASLIEAKAWDIAPTNSW